MPNTDTIGDLEHPEYFPGLLEDSIVQDGAVGPPVLADRAVVQICERRKTRSGQNFKREGARGVTLGDRSLSIAAAVETNEYT